MLTTYFRSSSINTYKMCPAKYFLTYVLGIDDPSGKAASKGSLFHKIMECLALKRKCQQHGKTHFNDDIIGDMSIEICRPDLLFNIFKDYYANESKKQWANTAYEDKETWTNADFNEVKKWIEFTLSLRNGYYDPRNCDIVDAEKFFDMDLPFEWAKYDYEINGQKISGTLRIRGSVDLIIRKKYNVYLIRDYKTGSLVDFRKKHYPTKTYDQLCEEFQFRLYYWVAKQFYKDVHIEFEAFYPKHGGPYDLYIDHCDGNDAITYMKNIYQKIQTTKLPLFIKNTKDNGPCSFCSYRKRLSDYQSLCDHYEQELISIGSTHKMFEKYGSIEKLSRYSGGGKNLILEKD